MIRIFHGLKRNVFGYSGDFRPMLQRVVYRSFVRQRKDKITAVRRAPAAISTLRLKSADKAVLWSSAS